MKILHCCLAAVYNDNYGYQENILPIMHLRQEHRVMIVASTETFIDRMNLGYVEPSNYITNEGIPITRLAYVKWIPPVIIRKLRIYKGLIKVLTDFEPDIIFLHDIQFLSIYKLISYLKSHPKIIVYADGHTDFINSALNWISKNILHKIIYKTCAKAIEPYLKKFYGVLPLRVEFILNEYKINPRKVDLLVMGGDHTNINFENQNKIKSEIRSELGIKNDDFLITSGGKLDKLKNIHLLMEAVHRISYLNIKLLLFGSVSHELESKFETYKDSDFIRLVGWKSSDEISNYFLASDLAFFPGTHSVLWEQAVSLGIPGIFKKWNGIQHLDVGGNCIFLDEISEDKIIEAILLLHNNKKRLDDMTYVAVNKARKYFSYYEIAKRAIEQ